MWGDGKPFATCSASMRLTVMVIFCVLLTHKHTYPLLSYSHGRINQNGHQTSSSEWQGGITQAQHRCSVTPYYLFIIQHWRAWAFNHRPPSAQLEAEMKLRDSDDMKSQLLESPQHRYSKNISTELHQSHLTQTERQKLSWRCKIS